jgi:hypothetical protein
MSAAEHMHRFRVGNSVRVQHANPSGNPRTPSYTYEASVTILHGSILNLLDHRGVYPPLYSVLVLVGEVFGGDSRARCQWTCTRTG